MSSTLLFPQRFPSHLLWIQYWSLSGVKLSDYIVSVETAVNVLSGSCFIVSTETSHFRQNITCTELEHELELRKWHRKSFFPVGWSVVLEVFTNNTNNNINDYVHNEYSFGISVYLQALLNSPIINYRLTTQMKKQGDPYYSDSKALVSTITPRII
jgi:hypothetical protein